MMKKRGLNYPKISYMFRFSELFNGRSLIWKDNRPEKVGNTFLKDKIIYHFRERSDLDAWHSYSDHMMNGHSWCELTQSKNKKTIMFRGFLSNQMPSDRRPLPGMNYMPFCLMQTNPWADAGEIGYIDFHQFDALEIKFRGDGRQYNFKMHSDHTPVQENQCDVFEFPLKTNGGPQWQTVRIPFSKFIASRDTFYCGQQYDEGLTGLGEHQMKKLRSISWLRVMINDGVNGPFQFEIDYIAVERC